MSPIVGHNRRHRVGDRGAFRQRLLACAALLALAPEPASAADGSLVTMAVSAGSIALAVAACLWALSEQFAAQRLRRLLRNAGARARASASARDALISAGREAVLVWGRADQPPLSYGGAELLMDACLKGSDAVELSKAIDALSDSGTAFSLTARDAQGQAFLVRGRAVGGMAAVWIEQQREQASAAPDLAVLLDAIPIPVWLRDKALSLQWVNRAYANAAGLADTDAVISSQTPLDKTERDLASAARAEGEPLEAKRFAVVGGQRRALAFTHTPVGDGRVVGAAIDVTEVATAEARLQQHIDAHADTLDKLATAVAIFGRDQRLTFFNRSFVTLWGLSDQWLETHPTDGEILDKLREMRKLPEQRDFQSWKRQRATLYEQPGDYLPEELWHVPGGKTLRVVAQPHPFGGLTFLYEDVTEKLALESSYNTLIKVQSATLDTLQEGVAVFGPDGRMNLHNASFARIWELDEGTLAGEPHVQRLADASVARFGDRDFWDRLVASISSGADRRKPWGEIERSDSRIIAPSLSPLPDGATLVTFADVTDRFRIESALRDRNDALEAADRLKSDFVQHASFLFRDPLNAVQGFAQMMAAGAAGPLEPKQAEYVQDILAAATKLEEVTGDILDLAMIDSGAMRLELGRVDLHELLARVAQPLRQHAESLDIAFTLDCADDVGMVIVDQRRIRQVVFNLLSNAFKFTPRGGAIVLGAHIEGDDVQIWVSDTGPGIAPEVKANVFERFSAKGRAGQRAGAGLGLALVNRFVELHDGWVEIASSDSHGTLVRAHLPRRLHDNGPKGDTKAA
ncbi:MAG: PAS domain-containing protein [Alphaproteobacteria bacterium]|nr:PAS domain-containing protein [Alphaproteobacteria bacterium]